MTDFAKLLKEQKRKLQKALDHLEYSFRKVQKLTVDPSKLSEADLETWESFSARFARVVDLFLTKYIRTRILQEDPGFDGTLRDFVNKAEKIELIDSAALWMAMRELRNITAHDYTEEELATFFANLKKQAPDLMNIRKVL